jgi:hypothetical protein
LLVAPPLAEANKVANIRAPNTFIHKKRARIECDTVMLRTNTYPSGPWTTHDSIVDLAT